MIEVKTDVAGSVWKIVAKVGDELAEDDPILIMESMKMEIPVTAPRAGRLAAILVAEGEMVAEEEIVAHVDG